MPFYAHPTPQVSPGDIFPEIPISASVHPLRILRKSKLNPPAKFGPQDLRRVFTIPDDQTLVQDLHLIGKQGEEAIVTTRMRPAMFLSWGSQVEADERDASQAKKTSGKAWLAAPIYSLGDIPEQAVIQDPETHEEINVRDVVRTNRSHNYFYLPPFPSSEGAEHYVDFRKIQPVAMSFFTATASARLVTLTEDSLNLLFSRLMWFFTRAEYFFQPLKCGNCGQMVAVDVRFEGQNLNAEPWE